MAENKLNVRIQQKYDTEENWVKNDPVLLSGELAFSSDKDGFFKVGDGTKKWSQLKYMEVDWNNISGIPETFTPSEHDHDDKYYTKNEIDVSLAGKLSRITVTDDNTNLNDLTTTALYHLKGSMVNRPQDGWGTLYVDFTVGRPYQIFMHDNTKEYAWKRIYADGQWGSWTKLMFTDTTYADATQETHGLMSIADKKKLDGIEEGANKYENTRENIYALVDKIESGTATPADSDYYISQWAGGEKSTPVKRPVSALWTYMKGKMDTAGYQTDTQVNQKINAKLMSNTIIDANTDWDTIKDYGVYKVQVVDNKWGDAATKHGPNNYKADLYAFGLLEVMKSGVEAENRTIQIYYPHDASDANPIVTRMFNSSAWTVWSPIWKGALPLNGNAVSASKLNPYDVITYTSNSSWKGSLSDEYVPIWGQAFVNSAFNNDSGDIVYLLKKVDASRSELNILVDGDIFSKGGSKVLNAGNYSSYALPLSGGTMSGTITARANQYADSYSGALNMSNSNIYGLNGIYTADNAESAAEGYNFYRDNTHVDSLWATKGVLYFTPNRELGTNGTSYTILHSNNYSSYALPLSGGTLTGVLRFRTNNYTGDILAQNADGNNRWEFYSSSNSGAAASSILRIYYDNSNFREYIFGMDGTLTAPAFKGDITTNPGEAGRYLKIAGGNVTYHAPTGGWANGLAFYKNNGTYIGSFGGYGNKDDFYYYFIGGTYDKPFVKIDTNGLVTASGGFSGNVTGHASQDVLKAGDTFGSGAVFTFADSGNWGKADNASTAFPVDRGGFKWVGQSDGVYLHAVETAVDNLDLQLQFTDDNSNGLSIRNASNTATARIGADGRITANAGIVSGAASNTLATFINTSQSDSTGRTNAGKKNVLRIWGGTYGNDKSYLASEGVLSWGDPGPQIQFSTSGDPSTSGVQDGALIFTDHDTIGTGVSLSFVSNQGDAYFIAPHIKALKGFVGNLSGNASTATKASNVIDSTNSNTISITYGKAGQASTSWLASWNGYELGAISPSKLSVNYATTAGSAAPTSGSNYYVKVYNSLDVGSSSSVTVNDLAAQGMAVGMIDSATDNPVGKASWVHVWSQGWGKTADNWNSQIALGVSEGNGMWYRTGNAKAAGMAWKRVLDSSNYNDYPNNKLAYFWTSRQASANTSAYGDQKIRVFLASSSMTTGKPMNDGMITQFEWDWAAYSTQLFISNSATSHLQVRSMTRTNDTNSWGSWNTILDADNYSGYAVPKSGGTMTGPITNATTSGGTWISGKTGAPKILDLTNASVMNGNRYDPLVRGKNTNGDYWNFGLGADDYVGFYGFYKARTDNGFDWRVAVKISDGTFVSTKGFTGHLYGTADSAGSATHAYHLGENSSTKTDDFGGLYWFNADVKAGNALNANDGPTAAWWYILRNRHTNTGNNYYTDIAIPFNANSIYYKRVANNVVQNNHWVKVLDDLNYSSYAVAKSGSTMTGQLYIKYDQDVGLNQNGSLIIGDKAGANIGIDGNEIMARNNSAASALYLNNEGGTVYIGTGGLSVNGNFSGKWSGYSLSSSVGKNTVPTRDSNGYTFLNYINSDTSNNENPTVSQFIVTNGSDNYYRKASLAHVKSSLGLSDGGWQSLSYASGWGTRLSKPCKYRKVNGIVYLTGLAGVTAAKDIAATTDYVIGTLPSGYRPSEDQRYNQTGVYSRSFELVIKTDGTINVRKLRAGTDYIKKYETTDYFSISCSFPV